MQGLAYIWTERKKVQNQYLSRLLAISASGVCSSHLLIGFPSMASLSTKDYCIFFFKSDFDVRQLSQFPLGNVTELHSSKIKELPYGNFNQIFILNTLEGPKFQPLTSWLLSTFHSFPGLWPLLPPLPLWSTLTFREGTASLGACPPSTSL